MIFNPTFYEKDGGVEHGYDLFSRLLKDRIVLVFHRIDDDLACSVIAQLLYLESLDPNKDISLYINSPGGSVAAGLGIYDTIKKLKCDVSTICVGEAASMGAFLLAAGTKGKRYAQENSQVMIHQVMGTDYYGQATDIVLESKHTQRLKARLNALLAANTGHTVEEVERDTDRNNRMFAEEAKQYGIVDHVLE